MIDITDLSYRVNNREILEKLNLTMEEGDSWLIFGPNGAGKTTLLKILCGFLRDFDGQVHYRGSDIKRMTIKELARIISYQPQFDEFSLPLKVREVLLAGRYPYKSFFKDYSDEDYRIYRDVVRRMDLEAFENRDITTLSGGERKKVLLASAFIQDVAIVFFDEPFSFLDPEAVANLRKMMVEMNRMGKTLVAVSHRFEVLFPVVNKILALKDGKILYAGPKVFDKQLLKAVYNTSFEKIVWEEKEIIFLDA